MTKDEKKAYDAARYRANPDRYKARRQQYKKLNRENYRAYTLAWHRRNPEKVKQLRDAWYKANPEKKKAGERAWKQENPHKDRAKKVRRIARQLRATPKWGNRFFIDEAYALARLRTRLTGVLHNVDHIVPINSSIVCGLHVEHNLRVIPASLNASKGNRVWEDMP